MTIRFVGNVFEKNVGTLDHSSQVTRVKFGEWISLEPQHTTDISSGVGEGKGTEAGDGAEKIADDSYVCRWKGFLVCNRFTGEANKQHRE